MAGIGETPGASAAHVVELCSRLDAEPLVHASLGSKELFHSNLIAWYVDHCPTAARRTMGTWTRRSRGTPASRTERERHHLDLVVHLADHAPLVVENKIFSPPQDSQLEGYAAEIASKYEPAPEFVLLSLSPPHWPVDNRELGGQLWHYRSYRQLAGALIESLELVEGEYARETVARYATIISALDEIAQLVVVEITDATPFALPVSIANALERVRLRQGFEKLRTRAIANFIGDHLGSVGLDHVTIVDNYTRSWPLLEVFMPGVGTLDEVGWQYQEGQWRLAVRLKDGHDCHGRGEAKRTRRTQYVDERYRDWFDFTDADTILGTSVADSPKKPGYRHFAPDFVYFYRAARNLTVGQLCQLAERTARRAAG